MVDITPLVPKEKYLITSYGNGGFTIGSERYDSSVIVYGNRVIGWGAKNAAGLSVSDFSEIIANKDEVEILLLGTGAKMVFPPEEISRQLKMSGVILEVMDTGAACRTYNVLLAEGRKVAAALIAV